MSVEIKINENRYNIDIYNLIVMGNRSNNSKRNFLFISKVLGKHIEVKPNVCKAIGFILASRIYGKNEYTDLLVNFINKPSEDNIEVEEAMKNTFKNNGKIIVLGFAETATGLGMAVASAIDDCYYLTTTREEIIGIQSMINFEEEHSHATTHRCFPINRDIINNSDEIILVDDEITTGKSMINIIKELARSTKVRKYTVLSILDWRGLEHKEMFYKLSKEEGLNIQVLSVISGEVTYNDNKIFIDSDGTEIVEEDEVENLLLLERISGIKGNGEGSYYKNSGRFGVSSLDIIKLEQECEKIAEKIQDLIGNKDKVLVLGHGENIYIPSRVASKLKGNIYFKSTTRSPIHCSDEEGYPIKEKNVFYDEGVKYYFYNKEYIESNYDKVVLITENNLNKKLCDNLIIVRI